MTLSFFSRMTAFLLASFAIGIYFKGYIEFTFLLLFIVVLLITPKKFWVALGVIAVDTRDYVTPKAYAVCGQAANNVHNLAHQAGSGFQAKPWFWAGVVTGVLGIGFLLGAAWNENVGTLQVSGVLFALSAICFITYYKGWRPLGRWLLRVITFVKIKGGALVSNYPTQVWLGVSLLFFALAFYNNWSTGTKWFWGISAGCAIITVFEWWPKVGGWALEILKTSVGGNGFTKMILLNCAILGICGYYISQNGNYNLGVLLTTGAVGFAFVAIGLKEFVGYGKK